MSSTLPDLASLENVALGKPATQSSLSPWSRADDAQGAVNGERSGQFGFHTAHEEAAWWRVDLLRAQPIRYVILWNRHGRTAERARHLLIELSLDGESWTVVGGTGEVTPGSARTGTPFVLACDDQPARFVRVRCTRPGYLHLDEVEVFSGDTDGLRLLRDLAIAAGEDPSAFTLRDKDATSIRFATPEAGPGDIASLTLLPAGRFGNAVTQLVNAIHLARQRGIRRIHMAAVNPPGLLAHREIGGIEFRLDEADGSAGPDLRSRLYLRRVFRRSLGTLDGAALAGIAETYLAPLFDGRFAPRPAQGARRLHIHLRSGDVFNTAGRRVPPSYTQPPLAFYRVAVEDARRRHGIDQVVLVHEDELNPCIGALAAWLREAGIGVTRQSASLEEDMAELMGAEHLVVSRGTFVFPVFMISAALRSVYGFRDDATLGMERVPYGDLLRCRGIAGITVQDAAGGYIDDWRNTPEQRATMLDYPIEALRLVEPD